MKNHQQGFVVPLLIMLAVLVLGGGAYIYSQKVKTPQVQDTLDTQAPVVLNQTPTQDIPTKTQQTLPSQPPTTNKSATQSPVVVKKTTPPTAVSATTLPAKTVIANAVTNQNAMNKFRAMYSGTETASEGTQSQSITFWSQEDKQDSRMRYSLYKGVVYDKDSVTKGYIGTIAETMYHFLNKEVSVSCVNTDQFCQAVGNSFAEYFARATASRGMELQSISKLFGLQVYGEPSLMNITSGAAKTVTLDSSASGQPTTKSTVCDQLNIVFSPTEVKKLASPSGQLSYETIDPAQSKFIVNLCIDRTTGLVDEYSTDLTIVSTDGQRQHTASNGKLLGYSTEVVFNSEFPFSTKVEQYNK